MQCLSQQTTKGFCFCKPPTAQLPSSKEMQVCMSKGKRPLNACMALDAVCVCVCEKTAGRSRHDLRPVSGCRLLTGMGLLSLYRGIAKALRAVFHDQQDEQTYCNTHNSRSIHAPPDTTSHSCKSSMGESLALPVHTLRIQTTICFVRYLRYQSL